MHAVSIENRFFKKFTLEYRLHLFVYFRIMFSLFNFLFISMSIFFYFLIDWERNSISSVQKNIYVELYLPYQQDISRRLIFFKFFKLEYQRKKLFPRTPYIILVEIKVVRNDVMNNFKIHDQHSIIHSFHSKSL